MATMTKFFLDLLTVPAHRAFVQTAALCLRTTATGPEVLLVQTLRLKQWVIPKGWPIDGLTLAQSAEQEAWEEAGVRGHIWPDPIGSFTYNKIKKSGLPVRCCAQIFRLDVVSVADTYPEATKRTRQWLPLTEAATLVRDAELGALLRQLSVSDTRS
jgi:8-oxo-dGTP pyrophosphatase MutT (NUDIX family)